jgi:hypothetical protein
MEKHEAARQVEYIHSLLAQNKKPIGFFIGAGCPLSIKIQKNDDKESIVVPLIPGITDLTKAINSAIQNDFELSIRWKNLIKLFDDDKINNPNIEEILTRIRSLKSVAGNGDVRGFKFDDLEKLDSKICNVISVIVNKELPEGQNSPYHDLAIWCRSIERDYPVSVFTTNYDLLLEQAFEESESPYFDGFVGSKRAFFDLGAVENDNFLSSRWTRLWKIHGSINWRLGNQQRVIRSTTEDITPSYLIFPSHLKYDQSRKMPYLAMLDRLQNFILKKSSILFICGYSFGDEHINEIISRALQSNVTSMVFSFMYGNIGNDEYKNAEICAKSTVNLSLLGKNGAIIGRRFGLWDFKNFDKSQQYPEIIQQENFGSISSLSLGDFSKFTQMLSRISGLPDHDE